jgi:hypothetical protein
MPLLRLPLNQVLRTASKQISAASALLAADDDRNPLPVTHNSTSEDNLIPVKPRTGTFLTRWTP